MNHCSVHESGAASQRRTIKAASILVTGMAKGEVRGTTSMLSFWGGYDPATGKIIDRRHPLCGETLTSRIFALPKGKGSSTGSAVLLDALVSGHGPAGIVMNRVDEIISLGVVVFEEFFGRTIPVVVLNDDDFSEVASAKFAEIAADGTVTIQS